MKTYKNLYQTFLSDENIREAIMNASKHKRKNNHRNTMLKEMRANPDKYIEKVRSDAANFQNSTHHPIKIYDGISAKVRTIIVPDVREQVVHHMIVQTLKPMMSKGMYYHSYASIPERGAHKAKRYIIRWIRKDPANVKYCLKMDIRKFFDSVDHEVLKNRLRKYIKDEKFLTIVETLIDATDKGIPLGFYTSQWLSNWLLQELDHYIKEQLGATYYVRYMDDMVVFGSNKKKLHKIRKGIEKYLNNELNLEMKANWQVFRFDYIAKDGTHKGRFLDFMGFRFYRDKTTLRRSIMLRCTRKAKKISKKEKASIYEIKQFLSYLGWLNSTDSYGLFQEYVKPYVTVNKMRKRISNYDKRQMKGAKICGTKQCQKMSQKSSTQSPQASTTTSEET